MTADDQTHAETLEAYVKRVLIDADARAAALAVLAENQRLREFVIAHTLVEKGVTDFDLQNEAVERLRRASEQVKDIIREALAGDTE